MTSLRFLTALFPAAALAAVLGLSACAVKPAADVISASGTIEGIDVRVAAKTGGQILELTAEEGRRVAPGDILARLDHASLDLQLRQAQAGVDLAVAQLALLRSGARREDIRQAEEALKQAETALKVALDDAARARDLAAKGTGTPKQKDDADARLAVSDAQWNSAVELLKKVRSLVRPEEIRSAEARLEQSRAAADLIRKTIADCVVVSPVAGFVTGKPVEAGETVGPGTTIAVVSRLDPVHLVIYVGESDLGAIRLGQEARISIDGAPGREFPGRVIYISPQAEFTPKNIQTKDDRVKLVFGVKIEVPNQDGTLKPGLPADAVLVRAAAR